jgi:hypothetical protein
VVLPRSTAGFYFAAGTAELCCVSCTARFYPVNGTVDSSRVSGTARLYRVLWYGWVVPSGWYCKVAV